MPPALLAGAVILVLAGCTAAGGSAVPAPRPSECGIAPQVGLPAPGAQVAAPGELVLDGPATVRLVWSSAEDEAWVLRGYDGRQQASGRSRPDPDGRHAVQVGLGIGYHEFGHGGAVHGLVVLPPRPPGPADPFFGLDAALTWLETDPGRRESLIGLMRRMGVGLVRERLGRTGVAQADGTWVWDRAPRRPDAIRAAYRRQGLPLLEVMDGTGGPVGRIPAGRLPEDLPGIARVHRGLAGRWGSGWAAVEVDNEPDLVAAPADQYVAQVKALSHAASQADPALPVVGGVFAGAPPSPFLGTCLANGMLGDLDAVSFHSYDRVAELEGVVAAFRAWAAAGGRPAVPLWLTESGWAWPSAKPRPDADDDRASAAAIAGKAVEARACGVARYLPFVLVSYTEGAKNFGMLAVDGTPLRSLAAYAGAIAALSGTVPLGDLAGVHAGPVHARAFARPGEDRLVVAITGPRGAVVDLPCPVLQATGADGRPLVPGSGRRLVLDDGVAYVRIAGEDGRALVRPGTAAAIAALAGDGHRRTAHPVVAQLEQRTFAAVPSARAYLVGRQAAARLRVPVRLANLGQDPLAATAVLVLPDGSRHAGPACMLDPGAATAIAWEVDASTSLDIAEVRHLVVQAVAGGRPLPPLAIPVVMTGDLAEHLARHPLTQPLPVSSPGRWGANLVPGGVSRSVPMDGGMRIEATFPGDGDRWCYPRFDLAGAVDPARHRGFVLRARIAAPAHRVAVIANPNLADSAWIPDLFPADGRWHVVYLPFDGFRIGPGNPGNQNTRIDPRRWRTLAVGMNSQEPGNAIEVSDLVLVGGG